MSINRGMDKEDVVHHIYNGILLSHKKEQNWAICRDVDGLLFEAPQMSLEIITKREVGRKAKDL